MGPTVLGLPEHRLAQRAVVDAYSFGATDWDAPQVAADGVSAASQAGFAACLVGGIDEVHDLAAWQERAHRGHRSVHVEVDPDADQPQDREHHENPDQDPKPTRHVRYLRWSVV